MLDIVNTFGIVVVVLTISVTSNVLRSSINNLTDS